MLTLVSTEVVGETMEDVKGVVLSPELIKGHLVRLMEPGKAYTTAELWPMVNSNHEDSGGLLDEIRDPQGRVSKCLSELKREGLVNERTRGQWVRTGAQLQVERELEHTEAEVELGEGREKVYGWYLPTYRRLAKSEGHGHFPLKVGRTARETATDRIEEHVGTVPERPKLGFMFKTDAASDWEQFIHGHLKLHGRHIAAAVGTEWFNTSPEELKAIVQTKLREIEEDGRPT